MSIVHVIIIIAFIIIVTIEANTIIIITIIIIIIAIDIDDLDKKTIHEIKTIIGVVNDQDNKGGGNTYL